MEVENSLLCSQGPATLPWPDPDEFSTNPYTLFPQDTHFNNIPSSKWSLFHVFRLKCTLFMSQCELHVPPIAPSLILSPRYYFIENVHFPVTFSQSGSYIPLWFLNIPRRVCKYTLVLWSRWSRDEELILLSGASSHRTSSFCKLDNGGTNL
jgi:hypothetical protein